MFAFTAVLLTACSKKDDLSTPLVGLGGDSWVAGDIDDWITANYTTPYNIEIKYKWDRSELGEVNKDVVPIKEDKVIAVMDAIKKVWIEPYIAVKDAAFFKKYSQKQFYLAGSPSYNSNGTITLGTAESGRKIVLLNLNTFDPNNKASVKEILHTIHHEFGHVLHQNIAFTVDFQRISAGDYIATWFNFSNAEARALGFITSYSRSNKDDDFVETLASLLVDGDAGYNAVINNLFIMDGAFIKRNGKGIYEQNTIARTKLIAKRQIVTDYLKNEYGITLTELQGKTQAAIDALAPIPDFNTILGPGKTYTTITVNPQKLTGLSAKFLTAFNTANTSMQNNMGLYIDNISLLFTTANKATLRINFMDPVAPLGAGYVADFSYDTTTAPDGSITLAYANPQPTNGNARAIEANIPTILAYFTNQQFDVRWVDHLVPQSKGLYGGMVKKTDATSYLFGTLSK